MSKDNFLIFLPFASQQQINSTLNNIQGIENLQPVLIASETTHVPDNINVVRTQGKIGSSEWLNAIVEYVGNHQAHHIILYTRFETLDPDLFFLHRIEQIVADTSALFLYTDFYRVDKEGNRNRVPLISMQKGSVRDDFDNGPLLIFSTKEFIEKAATVTPDYSFAALYALKLAYIEEIQSVLHIPEVLYTVYDDRSSNSATSQFDYVNPRNRDVQIEMEKAFTQHLKNIGAFLGPEKQYVDFATETFSCEASVIIPVKNRAATIADAIRSVLSQQATIDFNVIVVDNHSTDGTSEIIDSFNDQRVVHIIPRRRDLGIGGCWNLASLHPRCGKFMLQLDSDDIYSDNNVVARIVEEFYNSRCAMVIGSYRLTDFNLNTIPPGIIDHREWTQLNGANNALRINGLGAPRCFYTPVFRSLLLPDTSYGEDYALALRISRSYHIARIYDVLYLCRRWENNSDANLTIEKTNANNIYKDFLRTVEIEARKKLNACNNHRESST